MQFVNRFAAWTAVATLGVAGLFAATTATTRTAREHWRGERGFGRFMSVYLNLTPEQQTEAKAIFQDARQQSEPVRQQLMQTRDSLRAAIKADDMNQIKQLSATEGSEVGQLTAVRSSAFAKAYQMLTPVQKQKLADFEKAHEAARSERPGLNASK
jgi:Spy/CpxP family protein refolding chaperone